MKDKKSWHPKWMDDPVFKREFAAYQLRSKRIDRLTKWMAGIPLVGRLVRTFWFTLLFEGPYYALKPRWGALTFSYLNDGMKPTVWHTWRQITHDHVTDPYTGLYPQGAPRSLAEAKEWEARWAQERATREAK